MKRGILLAVIGRPSLAAGASAASWWRSRPRQVIDAYHIWYHRKGEETYNNTQWLGVEVQKSPLDMWMMQEILQPVKPDVLVEAGAYLGGSAYHFASLFELMGHGWKTGSSTSDEILSRIRSAVQPGEKVLVDLDSDHRKPYVSKELHLYSPLVTPGSYPIVEDTHFNGHPILPKFGPGPGEAVAEFLPTHPEFQPGASREKFGMTFNPGGYLRRAR